MKDEKLLLRYQIVLSYQEEISRVLKSDCFTTRNCTRGCSQGTKTYRNLWRIEMILLLFQSTKSKMHLLNEYHNETSAKVLQMWLLKAVKNIRLSSKKNASRFIDGLKRKRIKHYKSF